MLIYSMFPKGEIFFIQWLQKNEMFLFSMFKKERNVSLFNVCKNWGSSGCWWPMISLLPIILSLSKLCTKFAIISLFFRYLFGRKIKFFLIPLSTGKQMNCRWGKIQQSGWLCGLIKTKLSSSMFENLTAGKCSKVRLLGKFPVATYTYIFPTA